MADYTYIIMSNPVDGREDDYNTWYDSVHLDDVLKLPGFVAARRYEDADPFPQTPVRYKYMAVYDIQSDDIAATLGGLFTAASSGQMPISDATDKDAATYLFRARGPGKRKAG